MSNVISSFLVGIGFDFDKKSAQQIESGIDSIKSKALQLGSVVAGAFGLSKLTSGYVSEIDKLGKFGQVYSVAAEDVRSLGYALGESGGSLADAMSQLEKLERFRAVLLTGDASIFASFGIAKGDANDIINAKDALEAYRLVAAQFERASPQERINMTDALGFDQSGLLLLSKGTGEVDRLLEKYRTIAPITKKMTDDAAEFTRQWIEAQANVQGLADKISGPLLKSINEVTSGINEWFGKNRQGVWADIDRLISEGEDRLKKAGGMSWTDFTFWGNIGNLGSIVQDTNVMQNVGNDTIDWFKGWDIFNKGTLYETTNPYMQQIEEPAPAWLYRQTPASPLTPEDQPKPSGGRAMNTGSAVINLNATFEMDGTVLDRKIIRVVDGMAQTAMDDISSSTRG